MFITLNGWQATSEHNMKVSFSHSAHLFMNTIFVHADPAKKLRATQFPALKHKDIEKYSINTWGSTAKANCEQQFYPYR